MLNSKPVFITGATGSIGAALVGRLTESGQAVRAMVRRPERAAILRGWPNVEIVPGDLTRPESLKGCMEGCSVVYHCAAKLTGSNRTAFETINVAGTRALIDEAIEAGVSRFVHLSSTSVYGLSEAENITESFPWPKCSLPYVITKREAERIVSAAANQIPITIGRIGEVFGPGQYACTIYFIEKINQGFVQPPTESASGFFNLIYIDNLIDALLLLGSHPGALGETFNVVDGSPIRSSEYIRRLMRMAGKRAFGIPGIVEKGVAGLIMAADLMRGRDAFVTPGEVDLLLHKATISGEKIRAELGWKPAVNPEEAFRRTEQWLRSEGYLAGR